MGGPAGGVNCSKGGETRQRRRCLGAAREHGALDRRPTETVHLAVGMRAVWPVGGGYLSDRCFPSELCRHFRFHIFGCQA